MLNFKIRRIADVTILDLSGRISLDEARGSGPGNGVVLARVVRELVKNGPRKILLNLKDVTYMDSSGVGELTGSLTLVQKQGGELKLVNAGPPVRDLLRIFHLESLFDVKNDERRAIQSFSRRGGRLTSAELPEIDAVSEGCSPGQRRNGRRAVR